MTIHSVPVKFASHLASIYHQILWVARSSKWFSHITMPAYFCCGLLVSSLFCFGTGWILTYGFLVNVSPLRAATYRSLVSSFRWISPRYSASLSRFTCPIIWFQASIQINKRIHSLSIKKVKRLNRNSEYTLSGITLQEETQTVADIWNVFSSRVALT